jgi:hypothetical protein
MEDRKVKDYARQIAQRLLVLQCGGMDNPATWAEVGRKRGHDIEFYSDSGGGPGEYVSAEPGTGVVRINAAYSDHKQARVLVHEIAHAELALCASGLCRGGEQPGQFYGEGRTVGQAFRMGYDDNPSDIRHRIAKAVEELCFRKG